jgi:hypothetical protein
MVFELRIPARHEKLLKGPDCLEQEGINGSNLEGDEDMHLWGQ